MGDWGAATSLGRANWMCWLLACMVVTQRRDRDRQERALRGKYGDCEN